MAVWVVMLAAVASHSTSSGRRTKPSKPHILFLMPDDLGFNNVPWNPLSLSRGHLPNIEALRNDAIGFSASYVQRWCTPTRAAIQTGRYPFRNGWNQYGASIEEELGSIPLSFELLPSVLKRGGYYTAALGKWHLGHFTQEYTPHGRGYDYYFGFLLGSETHDTHNSWGKHTCSIPVTDLYNCSRPANDSVHYRNLTYSPEMYGDEMQKLVSTFGNTPETAGKPLFLYMAFQNNHAPYTMVDEYMARFPFLAPGGSRRVYNSNMAAVDDAVGVLCRALTDNSAVFGNNTLIVFTQDNGGPAKMANNLPLRGAKFGVYEGGVRSNSFMWGPGVLPSTAPGKMFDGLFHLVDYYATFAAIAGVDTGGTGPAGFDTPDGVNQWDAIVAVASGAESVQWPRTEVVIDLNPDYGNGQGIVALRSGDFKIIYGSVGETDVIADVDWPCDMCCPFRRVLPANSSTNPCAAALRKAASLDGDLGARGPTVSVAPLPCTKEKPCVYNVVNDINESVNLANDPAFNATLAMLRARLAYYEQRAWTIPIDHTNYTAAQYCTLVRDAGWVQPYGYAPPPPPTPPPSPTPSVLAGLLEGAWMQENWEEFRISPLGADGSQTVRSVNCSGCCWLELNCTASWSDPSNTSAVLHVEGDAPRCTPPSRAMVGSWSNTPRGGSITWRELDGRPGWRPWLKIA